MTSDTATDADDTPRVRQPLAMLHNHHIDEIDDPLLPVDDNDPVYVSTFMTDLGEQLMYLRREGDTCGYLFMGDLGWERKEVRMHTVAEMLAELDEAKREDPVLRRGSLSYGHPLVGDVILSPDESDWLWLSWRCGEITAGKVDTFNFIEHVTTYETVAALIHAVYFPLNGIAQHPNGRDYQGAMANLQVAMETWRRRLMLSDEEVVSLVKKVRALVDVDIAAAKRPARPARPKKG